MKKVKILTIALLLFAQVVCASTASLTVWIDNQRGELKAPASIAVWINDQRDNAE